MTNVERNVVYGMHSGLGLLMDVYRPEKPKGFGVVYINGSGWHAPLGYDAGSLKDTPLGLPYIEAMRAGGYTVFAINHRQAPRFRYPAAVEDAQRAVRFVRHNAARFGVIAERIGGCGGSSGGHLVSLLGTLPGDGKTGDPDPVNRESARVQCVVARAAPVDPVKNMSPIVADFMGMIPRGEAGGAYSIEEQTYRDASPINHVSSDTAPFLILAGTLDTAVPPEQATLMQKALETAGVPVEVMWIEGASHGPNFPGANKPPDYLGALVRWFDRHLVPAAVGAAVSRRSA